MVFMVRQLAKLRASWTSEYAGWGSIHHPYRNHGYRSELWFLKEILKTMSGSNAAHFVESASTKMLDAELAQRMTSSKEGLLNKVHTYIDQTMIDVMDMFSTVSQPLVDYQNRG